MLQFQNSRASELLAEEAAQSAKRMQDVTDQMFNIAQRTQEETTSMKIITSVSVTLTLFFLPATFTAVSYDHIPDNRTVEADLLQDVHERRYSQV
jgi:hypothetical protein